MSLMDDLDSAYQAKSVVLIDEGGWEIKLLEHRRYLKSDIKRYYITHKHKGYSWPVLTNFHGNLNGHMITSVTCSQCQKKVPKETLGFLELLKWEK